MTVDPSRDGRWALTPARVALAWAATVGIDLFFHAGVFAPVFDQSREPALLPDAALFRRIPVAYATLAVAVTALAWVLDRTGQRDRAAIGVGALGGLVVAVAGLVALWTAIDVTGLFVAAGTTVLVIQGAAASAVLVSRTSGRALTARVLALVLVLFVLGQVAANLTRS